MWLVVVLVPLKLLNVILREGGDAGQIALWAGACVGAGLLYFLVQVWRWNY